MKIIDKVEAVALIEDSITSLRTPHDQGMARGLCGGFYLCGLLSKKEWGKYLKHIQVSSQNHSNLTH